MQKGIIFYRSKSGRTKNYAEEMAIFLKKQDVAERKKYLNNFYLFIEHTKGIRNLSPEDKAMIKTLRDIK